MSKHNNQALSPSIVNPSFSYTHQFPYLSCNPSSSLPIYCYSPGLGAPPVYSDPSAASANWIVRQSAPFTPYSVHNLSETSKIGEPWCDVCKINCTSNDCLKMHLGGKKHQKSLRKLQNPIPLSTPTKAAAKTPVPVSNNAQHNLSKKRKIEEPLCDVCKIGCTSNDCLKKHVVGKKHQKNCRKLYNPIN